jgi:HK97 family phage major capsid protein
MGLNESERRAMGEGVGGAGGWFVNPLVSGYVIDLARNASCCMKAGAWTLPMDSPEVTLVKVLTDPTSYWLAEHGAISESDGSFSPIKLKAVILGTMIRVSQALLEDATGSGQTIEKMLSSSLGLELDRVALLGGNSANEPRGLYNCDDINSYSMGPNGAAPTNYDPFSYACQYVLEDNGTPTAAIMAPRTFGTLDRLKAATTNQPLVAPQSYQDLKKFYTNQVPVDQTQGTSDEASCAFVGDFQNMVVGMRKSLTIDVSPHAGTDTFAQVECLIRAYLRIDIAILRENHFTKIIGITE